MGNPRIRRSMPRRPKSEASDRPYGPAPTITTSVLLAISSFCRSFYETTDGCLDSPQHRLGEAVPQLRQPWAHIARVKSIECAWATQEVGEECRNGHANGRRVWTSLFIEDR